MYDEKADRATGSSLQNARTDICTGGPGTAPVDIERTVGEKRAVRKRLYDARITLSRMLRPEDLEEMEHHLISSRPQSLAEARPAGTRRPVDSETER